MDKIVPPKFDTIEEMFQQVAKKAIVTVGELTEEMKAERRSPPITIELEDSWPELTTFRRSEEFAQLLAYSMHLPPRYVTGEMPLKIEDQEAFNRFANAITEHMVKYMSRHRTQPLPHVYPTYGPPADDPTAPFEDNVQVWNGHMRIVHARRARKLRQRGVPLMKLPPAHGHSRWAWFVSWDATDKLF